MPIHLLSIIKIIILSNLHFLRFNLPAEDLFLNKRQQFYKKTVRVFFSGENFKVVKKILVFITRSKTLKQVYVVQKHRK